MKNATKLFILLTATMMARQATADQMVLVRKGDTFRSIKKETGDKTPNREIAKRNPDMTWQVAIYKDKDEDRHTMHIPMSKVIHSGMEPEDYATRAGKRRGWTLTNVKFGLRHDRGPNAHVVLTIPSNPCFASRAQCTESVRHIQALKGVAPSQPSGQVAALQTELEQARRDADDLKAEREAVIRERNEAKNELAKMTKGFENLSAQAIPAINKAAAERADAIRERDKLAEQINTVRLERDQIADDLKLARAKVAELSSAPAAPEAAQKRTADSGQRIAEQERRAGEERRLREQAEERANRAEAKLAAIAVEVKPLSPAVIAKLDPEEVIRHMDKLQRANAKLNGGAADAQDQITGLTRRVQTLERTERQYDKLRVNAAVLQSDNAYLSASERRQARHKFIAMLLVIALAGGLLFTAFSLWNGKKMVRSAKALKDTLTADGQTFLTALAELQETGGHGAGVHPSNRFAPLFERVRRVWTEGAELAAAWRRECQQLLVELANAMSLTFSGSMETVGDAQQRRQALLQRLREHQEMLVLPPDERTEAVTTTQFEEARQLRVENTHLLGEVERLQRHIAEVAPLRLMSRAELETLCRQAAEDLAQMQSLETLATEDPDVYRETVRRVGRRLHERLTRVTQQVPAVA